MRLQKPVKCEVRSEEKYEVRRAKYEVTALLHFAVRTSYLLLPLLFCSVVHVHAGQNTLPPDEMAAEANYDEVVRDLVSCLSKEKTTAQDAAVKLARLGRRSIPVLIELLKANLTLEPMPKDPKDAKEAKDPPLKASAQKGNPALAYYATFSLAHIRLADAAKPLLPLLENPRTPGDLRNMVIEALGLEYVPEAGALLQKIAAEDPDLAMRKKAYNQLAIMPNFWVASEKLFVTALSDPDDEIRVLAAKQCQYARIYLSATDKLIELSEKDPLDPVRIQAMLALSRMKVRKAVPALVRICVSPDSTNAIMPTVLRTLNLITGVSLKDAAAVQTWWTKFGEAEYAKLEAPPKAADTQAAPDPNAPKINATPAPDAAPAVNKKDAP